MPERNYSVVVFDLGNVLIPFNYDLVVERLNKIEPGLGTRFYKFYKDNYHYHRDYEANRITEEVFLASMLEALEHKVDADTFCRIFSEIFTVNDNVAALIPELKKKYKVVLLSNTNDIHRRYGWQQYYFIEYFDKLFLSHQIGAVKPEEAIYRAVEAYTLKPSAEHIFIDDVPEYAAGAKAIGWDAIVFTGYENLVNELKQREIL
jgi:putative hydrolase of the HAD superfamily